LINSFYIIIMLFFSKQIITKAASSTILFFTFMVHISFNLRLPEQIEFVALQHRSQSGKKQGKRVMKKWVMG